MIVRISLLLLLAALLAFAVMDILVWLAIPVLPHLLTPLGISLLFSGFGLLLITGLLLVTKQVFKSFLDYFSNHQRIQRRLLFIAQKQQEITRLFHLKTDKITYFAELKRKRLLRKNNKKHLRTLSKTINTELFALKNSISDHQFKQLRADHLRYKNSQNIDALLKLQQQITSITRT
ncbi:conserved hypothetical protein [Crenothrix polyspora]|uniref:Uncharacterized protein n=1 Tax=Crenothrix polyspora TaxID=360316 RepID=A0A1R4H2Y7_9GAMM|nr:hypothetical protein [Crenothrix polyspora]SJM90613.1 conserved hypothetical protein [Crenothrix polyspora]